MPVKWEGAKTEEAFARLLTRNMSQAMLFLKGQVQKKINRGNPTGEFPSAPGEPPKKVTGRLFQSIATEVTREGKIIIGRYGTNVVYARRLEFGFVGTDSLGRNVTQAPRPFLRPVVQENQSVLQKILGQAR